jgi:primosomal protein N''
MQQIIKIALEPATGENIERQYKEALQSYEIKLAQLRRAQPKSEYEKQLVEQEISFYQKEARDNRLHLASIKMQSKYALV